MEVVVQKKYKISEWTVWVDNQFAGIISTDFGHKTWKHSDSDEVFTTRKAAVAALVASVAVTT